MGWASGSSLMQAIIEAAQKELDCGGKDKLRFYKKCILAFKYHDCDTLDECRGIDPLFDKALEALNPSQD